jgi:hypothetical protein
MLILEQNKKIAISALAMFSVTFMAMIMFLNAPPSEYRHSKASVLDALEMHQPKSAEAKAGVCPCSENVH